MKTYVEQSREIPIEAEVDVLVVGGGPAGVGAALSAARNGVKTMLVEQFNCVGGMATSGMMSHFTGGSETPLFDEIMDEQSKDKSCCFSEKQHSGRYTIYHEALKYAMIRKLSESGVKLKLYTLACDAIKEGNRVTGVILESKSGRSAVMAKVVIDASGDGDIAARAGAEFVLGRPEDHLCQPVTMMFRIGGVDYSKAIFPGSFESKVDVPKGEIQSLGHEHLPFPAGHVLLYPAWIPGEVCVNMTNVTNIDGTNSDDLTKAEIVCREQINKIILFLREYAPGYEKCYLVSAAQNVGVRETRHFKGLYELTEFDVVEARVFEDWIATRNWFNFDIHSLTGPGLDKNGAQHKFQAKGRYTIPYRSCVPVKIDGLLLAGRNICGTHKAHSNFRVMPICMNIGQGVGAAAAVAVKDNVLPRGVDVKKVQALLDKAGVVV